MAHILLHLTSARLLEADENLHPLGREAIKRRRGLVQLGCVLADLPHFHGVYGGAIRTLLGRPHPAHPWAARLHHQKPLALGLRLVTQRGGDHPVGPLGRLALGIGWFMHAALDASLHPQVHALVDKEVVSGLDELTAHRRIERVQAMLIHPRLTGMPLDDDGVAWAACDLTQLADLERTLTHVDACVREERSDAPGLIQWHEWLLGLQRYASLARGRITRAEGGRVDVESLRGRFYDAPGFEDLAVKAQARALVWVNRLAIAFALGDVDALSLQDLAARYGEADLDGAQALPVDGLGPELSSQREQGDQYAAHAAAMHAMDNTAMGAKARTLPAPLASEPPESAVDDGDFQELGPMPPPIGANFTEMRTPAVTDPNPVVEDEASVEAESDGAGDDGKLRPGGRAPR